jgi:hypothetical protein
VDIEFSERVSATARKCLGFEPRYQRGGSVRMPSKAAAHRILDAERHGVGVKAVELLGRGDHPPIESLSTRERNSRKQSGATRAAAPATSGQPAEQEHGTGFT